VCSLVRLGQRRVTRETHERQDAEDAERRGDGPYEAGAPRLELDALRRFRREKFLFQRYGTLARRSVVRREHGMEKRLLRDGKRVGGRFGRHDLEPGTCVSTSREQNKAAGRV
jgi:hypothetical protein